MTSKLPVGSISAVTLIRTDTTLDHSQKAEKGVTPNQRESQHNVFAAQKGNTKMATQKQIVLFARKDCAITAFTS